MRKKRITFNIGLSNFSNELRRKIGSDLYCLEILIEALNKNEFTSRVYLARQDFSVFEFNLPSSSQMVQFEINKCFKSILTSLQDYIDKIITVEKFKDVESKLEYPVLLTNNGMLNAFNSAFEAELLSVSSDRKLNIPEKLKIILDSNTHVDYIKALQSYFDKL